MSSFHRMNQIQISYRAFTFFLRQNGFFSFEKKTQTNKQTISQRWITLPLHGFNFDQIEIISCLRLASPFSVQRVIVCIMSTILYCLYILNFIFTMAFFNARPYTQRCRYGRVPPPRHFTAEKALNASLRIHDVYVLVIS